jgi:hypothetical protein
MSGEIMMSWVCSWEGEGKECIQNFDVTIKKLEKLAGG